MLNYIWAFMILVGILWGAFHGNLSAVTEGAFNSAKEAITLCITMLGVMSLWTGVLEVGQKAGLIEQLSRKMKPILRFLFPHMPADHIANEHIATNMIANILGLGWAATPAGLRAMEALKELEEERRLIEKGDGRSKLDGRNEGPVIRSVPVGTASKEMCTFMIINISSLQLIPINMIAYRSQYGSVNPTVIVGPALVATLISTVVGVVFCRCMDRKRS